MNDLLRNDSPAGSQPNRPGVDGWIEAALFSIALAVLNVSYGLGQQLGVNPIALLFWAMPVGAIALLLASGLGPDWRSVVSHPLSLVVGGGIIAMEAVYYVLLGLVTPTDGSVLVRLGVPIAMLLGYLLVGRRPSRLGILGGLVIISTILWYVPRMETASPLGGLLLGATCGFIMSARSFAAEQHPWNRAARTIPEKMRVTGLVLLLACGVGTILLFLAMAGAVQGFFAAPKWLPEPHHLTHPPAIWLGLFVGAAVLTAMQYLGFSVVVKLGAENFVATTALIPVTTLGVQQAAVAAGLLTPIAVDWRVVPAMAGVILGVALVIAGGRRSS
jgi:drug/metabolite transporter (DMT)-like permease